MEPVDEVFFLIYHAVIQKPTIASDYNIRLEKMGQAWLAENQLQGMPPTLLLQPLQWYMSAHGYAFTKPSDHSVQFNVLTGMAGGSERPCGVSHV